MLLTGSRSIGLGTPDSDVDLIRITRGPPSDVPIASHFWRHWRYDTEELGWAAAEDLLGRKTGDLQYLRERSRILNATILVDHHAEFEQARAHAEPSRLSQDLDDRFAHTAALWRKRATKVETGPGCAFCLQQVAEIMALRLISRSHLGFLKPKWTLAGLELLKRDEVVELMGTLHGCLGADAGRAETTIELVQQIFYDEICQKQLSHDGQLPETYDYVARTIEDARSLAQTGRYAHATYVAHRAVIMLSAIEKGRLDLPLRAHSVVSGHIQASKPDILRASQLLFEDAPYE